MMHPVDILTFNEVRPAAATTERLKQAGIPAEVRDEHKLQKLIFFSPALGSVHVFVDNRDFERAKGLLREWDMQDGALRDALHCPECGSSRVQFPQFTRAVFISWVVAVAGALGLIERRFYCKECHFTWPVKQHTEAPRDILGWPEKKKHESSG